MTKTMILEPGNPIFIRCPNCRETTEIIIAIPQLAETCENCEIIIESDVIEQEIDFLKEMNK